MDPSSDSSTAEGCGRTILAVLAGAGAFAGIYALAATVGRSSPAPVATEFLSWLGAGSGSAIAFGLIAPGKRWGTGLPLLLFLELAGATALAFVMAVGDYAPPPGLFSGALAGCTAGIAVFALLGRQASWNTRRRVAGFIPAALGMAWVASWVVAGHDMARVRRDVLPAIERFMAADVLTEAGPVKWTGPNARVWSSGKAHILAYGPMQGGAVHLRLDAPGPLRGRADRLDGLTLAGLEIRLKRRHGLDAKENVEPVLRRRLLDSGVKPELVKALQWQQSPFSSDFHLTGSRHGVTYELNPNCYSDIGDYFSLRCTGVYASSAP